MLLEAVATRSPRGIALVAEPAALFLLLLAAFALVDRIPVEDAQPAIRLALATLWAGWAVGQLAARAHAIADWLRERVEARGGDGDPAQPARVPTTREANERGAPMLRDSLEAAQLSFMRDPGRGSCHLLALAGLGLSLTPLTAVAIGDYGSGARIAAAVCALPMALSMSSLYRGRRHLPRQPWRTREAPWPAAWAIVDPPSRIPGPVWLLGLVALFAATLPISHAGSIGRGVTLAIGLLSIFSALWAARHQADLIAAVERTAAHRKLARWVVRVAPVVWYAALALQVTLTVLGIALVGLTPLGASVLQLGLLVLAMAMIVRSARSTWQRPRNPQVIDLNYLTWLLGEPHLKKRVARVAAVLPVLFAVWTFLVVAA